MEGTASDHIAMEMGDEFFVIEHDQGTGWTRVRRRLTDEAGEEGIVPTAFIVIGPNEMFQL